MSQEDQNVVHPNYYSNTNVEREKKSLLYFFILSFAFSWLIFGISLLIDTQSSSALFLFEILPKFGFSLSGLVIAWFVGGKQAVIDILRRMIIGLKSWNFVLLGLLFAILMNFGGLLLHVLVSSSSINSVDDANLRGITTILLFFYWISFRTFLGGGMGEELGLRGFALPRMQERYGDFKASLYLGILWSLWHLPANIGGGLAQSIVSIIVQWILTISLSFVFTYLFNKSSGNLSMMIVFHGSLNGVNAFIENELFPILDNGEDIWIVFYILIIFILGIITAMLMKNGNILEDTVSSIDK